MAVRDPDASTRRVIDGILALLLVTSLGAYWKAYVAPRPEPAVQVAALDLSDQPTASRLPAGAPNAASVKAPTAGAYPL